MRPNGLQCRSMAWPDCDWLANSHATAPKQIPVYLTRVALPQALSRSSVSCAAAPHA